MRDDTKKKNTEKKKWRNDYFLTSYLLAKEGLSNAQIAKTIGVAPATYQRWTKEKPTLRRSLKKGRNSEKENQKNSPAFHEYIYDRLPPHLQTVWDQISEIDNEPSSVVRLEKLLEKQGERARQHLFIQALVSNCFDVSKACKQVNITTTLFRSWCRNHPDFHELISEMDWHKGNFFETALINLVKRGDPNAIIFANKTYNKSRGYSEKVEVEVSGSIEHTHHHIIDVEQLNLPLDTRKQILLAYRQNKLENNQEGAGENEGQ